MKNRVYRAVIAGSMAIVPIAVLRGLLTTGIVLAGLAGWHQLTPWIVMLQRFCMQFMPLLLAIFLSLHWAIQNRLSSLQCVTSTVLAIVIINAPLSHESLYFMNVNVILAIIISVGSNLFHEMLIQWLVKTKIKNGMARFIINLLCVAMVSTIVGIVIDPVIKLSASLLQVLYVYLYPDTYFQGLLYELARDLFWLLGINGHYVFQNIDSSMLANTFQNIADWHAGKADLNVVSNTFYDTWVASGGCGCTLSLVLCMLVSRQRSYRKLLRAVLPLAILNMNEPLVFGIPIILNPVMLIPFLMTPAMSYTVAYIATVLGVVPHIQTVVGWSTPPLLNIWLATNGSISAVILHAFIIIFGAFLYYPFLMVMESRSSHVLSIPNLKNLDLLACDSVPMNAAKDATRYTHLQEMAEHFAAREQISELQNSGKFILYFQPQVRLHDKRITAIEVLLRHQSYSGAIKPPVFLKYYERLGLMAEVDYWVLENAVNYVRDNMSHLRELTLAINISPQTLADYRLMSIIEQVLEKPLPEGWKLEFEITESQQLHNPEHVIEMINWLRTRNIKIALDDFGSGYATLAYLNQFSLDKIKLDRSLLQVLTTFNNPTFFSKVVELCHYEKTSLLAEGIETEEEYAKVKDAGVEYAQGFLFYRPLPGDEVCHILTNQQAHYQ